MAWAAKTGTYFNSRNYSTDRLVHSSTNLVRTWSTGKGVAKVYPKQLRTNFRNPQNMGCSGFDGSSMTKRIRCVCKTCSVTQFNSSKSNFGRGLGASSARPLLRV